MLPAKDLPSPHQLIYKFRRSDQDGLFLYSGYLGFMSQETSFHLFK